MTGPNTSPRAGMTDDAPPRGCLPTLLVLLTMVFIVGAGTLAAEAAADLPAQPIALAHGVTVTPVGDWEFGGRSEDPPGVLLSKGNASLLVLTRDDTARPEDAIGELFAEWQADSDAPIAVGQIAPVEIGAGRPAARGSYSGAFEGIGYPVEGEVTAIAGTNVTVLFDAWAGFGEFALARAEIDAMIAGTTIP